jgi:hypothetical protein
MLLDELTLTWIKSACAVSRYVVALRQCSRRLSFATSVLVPENPQTGFVAVPRPGLLGTPGLLLDPVRFRPELRFQSLVAFFGECLRQIEQPLRVNVGEMFQLGIGDSEPRRRARLEHLAKIHHRLHLGRGVLRHAAIDVSIICTAATRNSKKMPLVHGGR